MFTSHTQIYTICTLFVSRIHIAGIVRTKRIRLVTVFWRSVAAADVYAL